MMVLRFNWLGTSFCLFKTTNLLLQPSLKSKSLLRDCWANAARLFQNREELFGKNFWITCWWRGIWDVFPKDTDFSNSVSIWPCKNVLCNAFFFCKQSHGHASNITSRFGLVWVAFIHFLLSCFYPLLCLRDFRQHDNTYPVKNTKATRYRRQNDKTLSFHS